MPRLAEAGIVHLRLIVPTEETEEVLQALERSPAVLNLVRLPGSSLKPAGDFILCDVAREEVSVVVELVSHQPTVVFTRGCAYDRAASSSNSRARRQAGGLCEPRSR